MKNCVKRNFGQLCLAPFSSAFEIPKDIRSLVRRETGAADFMEMMLSLGPKKARSDSATYHRSFSSKLFLEEEANLSEKFDRLHITNVRIQHYKNEIFQIIFGIDVNIHFNLILC